MNYKIRDKVSYSIILFDKGDWFGAGNFISLAFETLLPNISRIEGENNYHQRINQYCKTVSSDEHYEPLDKCRKLRNRLTHSQDISVVNDFINTLSEVVGLDRALILKYADDTYINYITSLFTKDKNLSKLFPISGSTCNHPNSPDYALAKLTGDDGVRLYNLGKTTEALNQYKKALSMHPDLQSARYNMAMIMMEWGKIEDAVQEFGIIKDLMSKNKDCSCIDKSIFHTNYGAALYQAKQPEKAIAELVYSIELNPSLPESYLCAGHICFDNKMYEESLFYYENYSKFRYYDEMVRLRMGAAYEVIGLFNRAIDNFTVLCSLNKSAYNHHMLGVLYYKNKDFESAISCYKKCIKIDASYIEAYYSLANVMREQELYDEAIQNYKMALSINNNLGKIHCNLGGLYRFLNMRDEAIAEFKEAIRCDDKDMIALRGLTEILSN